MPTERRIQKMQAVLKNRQQDLMVVCENIHDPHNVSAILRSCDAVGVAEVILFYTRETFPKLGKKSSASAKKWVQTKKFDNPAKLQEYLHTKGTTIYATRVSPDAKSIFEIDWSEPAAIIVGNEHKGVSKEGLTIAHQSIYIPMMGMVESLNVSVATAVILYEAYRQRAVAGKYPFPASVESEWLQKQLDDWMKRN